MLILSIDTSCDETSVAITEDLRVVANIVSSQIELHKKWGGVVPSIAKRAHRENLEPAIKEALFQAKVEPENLDAIAVTYGPGLAIALEVGISRAKEMAVSLNKPLIAVDHMEAHLLSAFAEDSQGKFGIEKPQFPALGLLVSGGHTELVLMKDYGKYELVGQTLDDAVGECFDKVAKLLGLGYPGGAIISKMATEGNPDKFRLPVPMINSKDLNFSYSGLKTACRSIIQDSSFDIKVDLSDFCASFEKTIIKSLLIKLSTAIEIYRPKMILLGGGVISSKKIQQAVKEEATKDKIPVHIPFSGSLLTDNAAMVGAVAYFKAKRKDFVKDIDALDRIPGLEIGENVY
ncbi:MAG: tRNA N6-adenosine threonylcarbamoyltransferase [Microgenomates group bacterium ADurb.Bin219]|nr:MAG: tRNA N6-adenosine threonylcarbamoyltransferase [Microgenomates group bacterium ADurb.Bin219]HNP89239.1 tRNA (adenosine(37)-N6)-threonylcarbamoyltransferase complex transferase subunit TsaD [Candidatus Woesebacteria bacterium]